MVVVGPEPQLARCMGSTAIILLLIAAPYLLLPVVPFVSRSASGARLLAIIPAGLAAWFATTLSAVARTGPITAELDWAPSLGLTLSFHLDGLGLLLATIITTIGALVVLYGVEYLHDDPFVGRFLFALFAFMGSMLGVVLSDNILLTFVYWELTGFTSFFLIAYDHEREDARRSALQALIVTGAGGLALLAAGALVSLTAGTTSLTAMRASGIDFTGDPLYPVIAGLVLLAAFTKSAQFPFHFWLPNAMEAPTPASAYLHSATMVKAGVYLVARMTPVLGGTLLWTGSVAAAGLITMLLGGYRSIIETDLKRILAYTTISALGAMMLMLSAGTALTVGAALVYLLAHACYKGALFLVAGAVDHGTGTRDVAALSGLRGVMPRTAAAGLLAALSMAGVPLLFGFVAKEGLYGSAADLNFFPLGEYLILGASVVASALLGAAGLTAGYSAFAGRTPHPADAHEPSVWLWLPPLLLGITGLALGAFPGVTDAIMTAALTSVVPDADSVHLALWHGFTFVLVLSGLTLVLTLLLYRSRNSLRRAPVAMALATERLYTGTIDGLDRISRRIAPPLYSGSLPSYVRVIVVTAATLVAVAFLFSGGLPDIWRGSPIRGYEAAVAVLIMVAAVATALARSAMAAVLSLGAVGYGIALLYVLFGAPDLAATQFAIETLTVVIFVLVFYDFSGFGDRLSRFQQLRDAAIAGAVGITITVLVLVSVGSLAPSRLADYFIESAPALAHGRNVVNVILVDFRAFDTMGEITVLVTVAIGVRALLQIGKEGRQ